MASFVIHLLAGAVVALLFQNNPLIAVSVLIGSVFPDIDCKSAIPHQLLVIIIGLLSVLFLYNKGLVVSIAVAVAFILFVKLVLPRHRGWMHNLQGQLLFSLICFLITQDVGAALGGFLGTSVHRFLDLH